MNRLEQVFRKFHSINERLGKENVQISVLALRKVLEEGLDELSQAMAETAQRESSFDLTKLSARAEVWARVWAASISIHDVSSDIASNCANDCLDDFDGRFPEYKKAELQ